MGGLQALGRKSVTGVLEVGPSSRQDEQGPVPPSMSAADLGRRQQQQHSLWHPQARASRQQQLLAVPAMRSSFVSNGDPTSRQARCCQSPAGTVPVPASQQQRQR